MKHKYLFIITIIVIIWDNDVTTLRGGIKLWWTNFMNRLQYWMKSHKQIFFLALLSSFSQFFSVNHTTRDISCFPQSKFLTHLIKILSTVQINMHKWTIIFFVHCNTFYVSPYISHNCIHSVCWSGLKRRKYWMKFKFTTAVNFTVIKAPLVYAYYSNCAIFSPYLSFENFFIFTLQSLPRWYIALVAKLKTAGLRLYAHKDYFKNWN